MRIDKIEAIAISIPLKKNFGGSTYDVNKRCTIVTRVHAGGSSARSTTATTVRTAREHRAA